MVRSQALLELQSEVLRAVGLGRDIATVAALISTRAEALVPGAVCSVLRVDETGRLRPLAAPSLPDGYNQAIDGLPCGPVAGSCGTAAWRREEVIVTDIASDPLWAPFRHLAAEIGVAACWSSPVFDADGRVVATFAFYWRTCRGPDAAARAIVETCVDLVSIAIHHDQARADVHRLAYVDRLTGLPNRAAFEDRAEDLLRAAPCRGAVGVHLIDLDDFKIVNDTLGHRVGDHLLAGVAQRLAGALAPGSLAARLGGDEFAVLAETADVTEQAPLAARLLAALREPLTVDGHPINVSASIGIALWPRHGRDLDRLWQHADMALYAAKRAGRNTYRVFTDEMAEAVAERARLKSDIAGAARRGEISVVYQPIVDLADGRVKGIEALARWTHPVHGAVSPARFVPLAEEAGTIGEIGAFVLERALADVAGHADLTLSVNASPLELDDPRFAARVAGALARHGVRPARFVVEVTETALIDRSGPTPRTLDDLKALGIGIALDDFGTGYSSLSLILDRRFNRLKIDRSFVQGIGSDPDCEAIVRATLAIAASTGFVTTAEGIETEAQRSFLAAAGCAEGQGYLIGRPMTATALRAFLAQGRRRQSA